MKREPISEGVYLLEQRIHLISKGEMTIDQVIDGCHDILSFLKTEVLKYPKEEYVPIFKSILKTVDYLLKNLSNNFSVYDIIVVGEGSQKTQWDENGILVAEIIRNELISYKKKLELLIRLCNPHYSIIKDIKPKFNLSVPHLGILLGAIWDAGLVDKKTVRKEHFLEFFSDNFSTLDSNDVSLKHLQNKSTTVTESERDAFYLTTYQNIKSAIEKFRTEPPANSKKRKKSITKPTRS